MWFISKRFIHTINDYSQLIVLRTWCKTQACMSTPTHCPPENGKAAVVNCSVKLFESSLSYMRFNAKELFFPFNSSQFVVVVGELAQSTACFHLFVSVLFTY